MKKIIYFTFILAIFTIYGNNLSAQVTENKSSSHIEIVATSYPDYYPISFKIYKGVYKTIQTIFDNTFDDLTGDNNIFVKYDTGNTLDDNIKHLNSGDYDVFLGIYNETHSEIKRYSNLEYIFPAVLNNPIHIITTPDNSSKIKTTDDLSTLKGVYISNEYLSDYVQQNFENNNIEPSVDVFDTYRRLFLGEIDYIIGSYYFHYVKSVELGLKEYISFSKKPLMTMPMFIAISKKSFYYDRLRKLLSKKVNNKNIEEKIKEDLKNYIYEFEKNNLGIVPPKFVLKESSDVKTPAEENL